MCLKEYSKIDGFPRFSSRIIKKEDRFIKPFHSLFWAAGFSFSYGTLVHDCGYTDELDDVFFGEELYLMWKFWRHSYNLYSPPKTLAYHLWERAYRKTYKEDHQADTSRLLRQTECIEKIKQIVFNDQGFLQEMQRRGVWLKEKRANEYAENGGIDQSFF